MKKIQFLLLSLFLCVSTESFGQDDREAAGTEIGLQFNIKHGKEFKACSYEIKITLDVLTVYSIAAEIDAVLDINDYPRFHAIRVVKLCTGLPPIPYEYTIELDADSSYINLDQAKTAIAGAVEKVIGTKVPISW